MHKAKKAGLIYNLFLFFSCPFDFVKVYDGADNESSLIGTYCGQQRNLVVYSSDSSMLVSFITLQRTANTQNRGFKGIFEFSESFVKLGKKFFKEPCRQDGIALGQEPLERGRGTLFNKDFLVCTPPGYGHVLKQEI